MAGEGRVVRKCCAISAQHCPGFDSDGVFVKTGGSGEGGQTWHSTSGACPTPICFAGHYSGWGPGPAFFCRGKYWTEPGPGNLLSFLCDGTGGPRWYPGGQGIIRQRGSFQAWGIGQPLHRGGVHPVKGTRLRGCFGGRVGALLSSTG